MQIDHLTLVRAGELCAQHSNQTRSFRVRLTTEGIMVEGMDRSTLPRITSYQQGIGWHDLASPVAGHILELKFENMAVAIDRHLEDARQPATTPG